MKDKKNNSNIQFEVNNLIDNAVNNAVARRNRNQDLEDALLTLSDEEMANVAGGFTTVASASLVKNVPIIAGGISLPSIADSITLRKPITCGLIAQDLNLNAQAF
ncbi:MAG: hypothetical protein V7K53_15230 [Nostoc sp.]|uniref:hypothetical protein n=1 Tax=Nostoc sp. TaxID=1180 RepID=UPI002FF9AD8C